MTHETYRERIYRHYVDAGEAALAPPSFAPLNSRLRPLRGLVRRHFPDNREVTVLDLGCGHGALIHAARLEGYSNIRGVDGSLQQVEAAERLGIEGVSHGDLLETLRAEPSQSVDVALAFDVLEHFAKDELIPFVDEVARVLKPGGRWIIHVPNGASPFFGRVRYGDLTHELAFTDKSMQQLMLSSGFIRVSCFEDEPFVHGIPSAIRWVGWKLIRAILRAYMAIESGTGGGDAIYSQNLLAVAERLNADKHF